MHNFLHFLIRINFFITNYYKYKYIPYKFRKILPKLRKIHVVNILNTAKELLNNNKSLSRFGDGELRWLIGAKKSPGFEKNSPLLSKRLNDVLQNKNNSLMICLPGSLNSLKYNTRQSAYFWESFYLKYGCKFLPIMNRNWMYYDTSVSRPYMDYNNVYIARKTFNIWKRLWKNKEILIIEGNKSHLGVNDDLFQDSKRIKRIECPYINAFESYKSILYNTLNFLNDHPNYITLISLGPTATIMSYDLCNYGYRAIDIGHIDVEYDWFLKGAKEKIDLPYHYVNELSSGRYSLPIRNHLYEDEIIKNIR